MTTRRSALKLLAGAAAVPGLAMAFPARATQNMVITTQIVLKNIATEGPGGDITAEWCKKEDTTIEWQTLSTTGTNERALMEASLPESTADVVYMQDRVITPQYTGLFEDLGAWQAKEPIPDFEEIPASVRAGFTTADGKLVAMPVRQSMYGLHYNTDFFAERGIQAPPQGIDEFAATAEKLTYERSDGTKVYGFVTSMEDITQVLNLIRTFGGDFITPDYKIATEQPETIRAITMLRDLVTKGVIPSNIMNIKGEDTHNFIQQGRAAMTTLPFGRHVVLNDPKASKFPGKIATTPLLDKGGKVPALVSTTFWVMAIPKGAKNKALSWSFIRHLTLPESTVAMVLNGNGPIRPSAYNDARVKAAVSYAAAEQSLIPNATLIIPRFDNNGRAMDLFMEELGLAILSRKSPEQAMTDLKNRVQPLLPT